MFAHVAGQLGDFYFAFEFALEAGKQDLSLGRFETVDDAGDGPLVVRDTEETQLLVDLRGASYSLETVRMASKSTKKPSTTSSDGHESRRWREGASTRRDAEIARSLCTRGRPPHNQQTRPVLTTAARSSGPRPASSRRPCPPDRRRPPSASRSRVDASRGPRSSPALRPRWTYRGPCSILPKTSTRCSQWSPSRPRTRGPALYRVAATASLCRRTPR